MSRIRRHHQTFVGISLTDDVTTTQPIDTTDLADGCVLVPDGSPITSLTYYGAREPGADFVAIQDATGNPVAVSVVGGKGYPIPDACLAYGALKLVADTAGNVDFSFKG